MIQPSIYLFVLSLSSLPTPCCASFPKCQMLYIFYIHKIIHSMSYGWLNNDEQPAWAAWFIPTKWTNRTRQPTTKTEVHIWAEERASNGEGECAFMRADSQPGWSLVVCIHFRWEALIEDYIDLCCISLYGIGSLSTQTQQHKTSQPPHSSSPLLTATDVPGSGWSSGRSCSWHWPYIHLHVTSTVAQAQQCTSSDQHQNTFQLFVFADSDLPHCSL